MRSRKLGSTNVIAIPEGSATPLASSRTYSGASGRSIAATTASTKSSRIVQHTQPLARLMTSSLTPMTSSVSMLIAPKSLTSTATRSPCAPFRMRLSSVVFLAPRNPVRTVTGTALTSSATISIWTPIATLLLHEFAEIDIHRLRQRDQIHVRWVRELSERFAIDVGWIVLPRIDLEIARLLFLLILARQPRLGHNADAGIDRKRIAEQERGIRKWLAREPWHRSHSVPDRVLGHVDDGYVRRAVKEEPIPVRADAGTDLVEIVVVILEMGDHRATRVDLLHQLSSSVVHRVVSIDRVVIKESGQSILVLVDARQIRLHLGDEDVDVLCILGGQIVRPSIACPDKRKAVPIQTIRRSAILSMRTPPMANRHAIFFVADAILVFPVELVHLHFVANPYWEEVEGF